METQPLANTIRSAFAKSILAAGALDHEEIAKAHNFARLGQPGTDGMVEVTHDRTPNNYEPRLWEERAPSCR